MPTNFAELVDVALGIINSIIPLLVVLTIAFVIWRVTDAWIINAGDENKVSEGKQAILAGVLALVCMTALWSIVAILRTSLFGG